MNSDLASHIKFPPGFWEGVRLAGIEAHDIARKAGLPLAIIHEPVVTTAQYFAIWQAYSDLMGDVAEGIVKLATSYETAKYPPTVLATYHARDYRDALHRMARYKQLCPPESLRITEQGEQCTIELAWLYTGQQGPAMLIGITLAYLLELGRRGTGQYITAQLVEFSQPMGNVQVLEAYFGCRIRVNAACNRLTLNRRDLDRPFVSYNEELLEILTPVLDRSLEEELNNSSITEKVKWMMKRSLAGGSPDMGRIAKELGISERTLQRRLADEHTSFKQLLAEVRHEQALEFLSDPSLDIKEVAYLVGYEDQNSFYRAFRFWEGDTPSHWRAERVGADEQPEKRM